MLEMNKIIIILSMLSVVSLRGQYTVTPDYFIEADSSEIHKQSFMDIFSVIDKAMELFGTQDEDDPVRVSKANKLNEKVVKKMADRAMKLKDQYNQGKITFTDYMLLKSQLYGKPVGELLEEESLIKAYSYSINED